MQYAKMGNTGLIVSRVSLGTMTFGSGTAGKYTALATVDEKRANEMVARALDQGVNSFNSAATYSGGESEAYLGKALGARRADVVITTKVGFRSTDTLTDSGLSRRSVVKTAEECLRRLNTDWIDVFEAHRADSLTPLDEILEGFDQLVRQGKVRYIGFANWPAWMAGKAIGLQNGLGWARFRVAELFYSLIGRDIEHSLVPLLEDAGVGLFVWSPLAGGLLSGKYTRNNRDGDGGRLSRTYRLPFDWERAFDVIEATLAIAGAHGATPGQVALAWLMSKSYVTSILVGVTSLEQLEENLGALNVSLTSEELARLDQLTELTKPYPNWFIDRNRDPISTAALAANVSGQGRTN